MHPLSTAPGPRPVPRSASPADLSSSPSVASRHLLLPRPVSRLSRSAGTLVGLITGTDATSRTDKPLVTVWTPDPPVRGALPAVSAGLAARRQCLVCRSPTETRLGGAWTARQSALAGGAHVPIRWPCDRHRRHRPDPFSQAWAKRGGKASSRSTKTHDPGPARASPRPGIASQHSRGRGTEQNGQEVRPTTFACPVPGMSGTVRPCPRHGWAASCHEHHQMVMTGISEKICVISQPCCSPGRFI